MSTTLPTRQTVRSIYIAGPMRGYPDHNVPAFERAEALLGLAGFAVVSPVNIGREAFGNDPKVPGGEYLRLDVRALSRCDAIALLPGWEASTGARCEVVVALTIGLPFFDALTGLPMPAPTRVVCNGGYEQPAGAVAEPEVNHFAELLQLQQEITAWQRATFPQATAASTAAHLAREVAELVTAPRDRNEIADVWHLLVAWSNALGIRLVSRRTELITLERMDGFADRLRNHPRDVRCGWEVMSHLLTYCALTNTPLASIVRAKFERNKQRTWGAPDAEGVVEHVTEGAA